MAKRTMVALWILSLSIGTTAEGQSLANQATKYEIGAVIRTPALIQPVLGIHVKPQLGLRLSGMVLPDVRGGAG